MSIWDDPEVRAGGEFVRFTDVGDKVSGVITAIKKHRFDDGNAVPQIQITTDEGEERTLTAGQVQLKAKLAELRPDIGDHLTVRLERIEKRGGGKTLKHFEVQVRPAAAATSAGQPPF